MNRIRLIFFTVILGPCADVINRANAFQQQLPKSHQRRNLQPNLISPRPFRIRSEGLPNWDGFYSESRIELGDGESPDYETSASLAKERNRTFSPFRLLPRVALCMILLSRFSLSSHAATSIVPVSGVPTLSYGAGSTWVFACLALLTVTQTYASTAFGGLSFALAQFSKWYMSQLTANPLVVKSLTAGAIGIVSDYIAQWTAYRISRRSRQGTHSGLTDRIPLSKRLSINGRYDIRRGFSKCADGLLLTGPLLHLGYGVFESILPINHSTGSSFAALCHVLADTVFLDGFFVATTFFNTGILEGYSVKQVLGQFKKDYFPTVKAGWLTSFYLMPLNFLCFRFLPLSCRVLAVNVLDIVWDSVISFMAHRNRHGAVHEATGSTPYEETSDQTRVLGEVPVLAFEY